MFFFTHFNVMPYSKEELDGYILNEAELIILDKNAEDVSEILKR